MKYVSWNKLKEDTHNLLYLLITISLVCSFFHQQQKWITNSRISEWFIFHCSPKSLYWNSKSRQGPGLGCLGCRGGPEYNTFKFFNLKHVCQVKIAFWAVLPFYRNIIYQLLTDRLLNYWLLFHTLLNHCKFFIMSMEFDKNISDWSHYSSDHKNGNDFFMSLVKWPKIAVKKSQIF